MAGCFVVGWTVDTNGDNLDMKLDVVFFATGLKDMSEASVQITPGDTLAQVKNKVVTVLTAEAARLGYTVPAANMILPAFQKGA